MTDTKRPESDEPTAEDETEPKQGELTEDELEKASGGAQTKFSNITLKRGYTADDSSSGDPVPMEQVSLNYTKITH